MTWSSPVWTAGGYLAGTLPSTFMVGRAKNATGLIRASGRRAGETDPHILMVKHLGVGWTALAATLDVLKGFVLVLAARRWAHLDEGWLAFTGVAVVVGHMFPFYGREMAGRGMAATAGVLLVLLPVEMVACGLLIVLGGILRMTGLASTIGLVSVPTVAAVQGQPGQFVAMAVAIVIIIMIRRLEGVGEVIRTGVSPASAIAYRCLFDSSGPPAGERVWDRGREDIPPA